MKFLSSLSTRHYVYIVGLLYPQFGWRLDKPLGIP
jgi:hypothetical protein